MWLDFIVARRGLDPAAETCEGALRDLLHAPVAGVERAALWRFEVGALSVMERVRRCERIEAAACRAGRYVNLNRDVCAWAEGPRPYPAGAPPGGCAVDLWVRDGEGEDAVALAYFRAQADPSLVGLRRGMLWRLWVLERDPGRARDRALELAIVRSRRQGLLVNPHAQTAEVLHVVPSPSQRGGAP